MLKLVEAAAMPQRHSFVTGCLRTLEEKMEDRTKRGDETSSLGNFAKSQTKYGSTARNLSRTQKFIKHIVSPTDTLQGLSLKYGVSMEDLKRVNKIWTNDSIFLRKTLDIPVKHNSTDESSTLTNGHSVNESAKLESTQKSEQSVSDLFGRIDCTIAQSKDRVKSLQQSTTCSALDLTAPCSPRSSSRWRSKHLNTNSQSSSSQDDDSDLFATPAVITQGHKVKNSLKKLQEQHDEIFEL